jgi:hypothetical protein
LRLIANESAGRGVNAYGLCKNRRTQPTTYEDMTSNMPLPHSTPHVHDSEKLATAEAAGKGSDSKHKLDLSVTQITGGALAAMTAAALGSRLGVAGTISGAAVASIVAGVAGSLYTASLRHTREKVKTVWSGRIAGTETPASVDVVPETPVWDLPQAPVVAQHRTPRNVPWKGMLAGAAAAFAIAVVALTGFELLSGSALSGGHGTTIQQVTEPHQPAPKPSKAAATESATPTPTPTDSATPEVTPAPKVTEAPTTAVQSPSAASPSTGGQTPTPSASTATPSSGVTPAG